MAYIPVTSKDNHILFQFIKQLVDLFCEHFEHPHHGGAVLFRRKLLQTIYV